MIQIERALDALGDPTRRAVFNRLRKGNRSVREIADGADVSRPAVSQHLKVLKTAGLVVVRTEGTRHLYGVDAHGLEVGYGPGSTDSGTKRSSHSKQRRNGKRPKK